MALRGTDTRITEGVIWKQLLGFFFPILLGTFFQQLYNTADAMIVGQFVGKEALAAVGGTTSVLVNFLVNLFVGLASGSTVVISQYYGAGRQTDISRAVHTAIAIALSAGGIMMVIGLIFAPYALSLMGTPPGIFDYALTYLRVIFFGMIPSFIYNMGAGILRAVGDTRRPLFFLIIACLTNIGLDLLFVVVFDMAVLGVAIATIISQLVSSILIIFALLKAGTVYQVYPKEIRFHKDILNGIFKVGIPAGLQSNMYSISNMLIQSAINTFGTDTIAAWTAFGKLDGFFWMVLGAYGISITTFTGQNFGAHQYERIRKGVRVSMSMALATTAIISTVFCLCAGIFLRVFTNDQSLIELGATYAWYTVPFYFTYVAIEIFSGTLRGTGDSLIPLLMTGFGVCVLRIVWIYAVLPLHREFYMVAFSYPITWAFTSILFICYYLHGGWLCRRIAKCGFPPEIKKKKGLKQDVQN